jgi:hypothetical protein
LAVGCSIKKYEIIFKPVLLFQNFYQTNSLPHRLTATLFTQVKISLVEDLSEEWIF